jgi:hypothetical protein
MSYTPYSLEIISQHSDYKGKALKKYAIDGIETVGAFGNEPFEILFTNNTATKVQVKISLDGTDILTGDLANTEINKDMWVVGAFASLRLKAWPETNSAGAQFLFTTKTNSVSVHLHGDTSSRGVIAAAVFSENHKPQWLGNSGSSWSKYGDVTKGGSGGYGGSMKRRSLSGTDNRIGGQADYSLQNESTSGSLGFNETNCSDSVEVGAAAESANMDYLNMDMERSRGEDVLRGDVFKSKSLHKSAAFVGAGSQVTQNITTATGLIDPKFAQVVKVKYLWWDELEAKLHENAPLVATAEDGSGFPGDRNKKIMSIGCTPRVVNEPVQPAPRTFSRF